MVIFSADSFDYHYRHHHIRHQKENESRSFVNGSFFSFVTPALSNLDSGTWECLHRFMVVLSGTI